MPTSAAVVQSLGRIDAERMRKYRQNLDFFDGRQWLGNPRGRKDVHIDKKGGEAAGKPSVLNRRLRDREALAAELAKSPIREDRAAAIRAFYKKVPKP